jgi:ferredoxin
MNLKRQLHPILPHPSKCVPLALGDDTMERIEAKSALRNWWSYRSEPMTVVSMQHIPLTHAYLCQDCNSIGNCAQHCPACASEALMGLAGVLDRKTEEVAQISYTRRAALAA